MTKSRRDDVLLQIRHSNSYASRTTAARISTYLARTIADSSLTLLRGENHITRRPQTQTHAHHLSHTFTGCQILLPPSVKTTEMMRFLRALPESVVRAKALVTTTNKPDCRQLFERVGKDFLPESIEVPISEKVPPSAICIGPKLDPQELLKIALHHFGPTVALPQDV